MEPISSNGQIRINKRKRVIEDDEPEVTEQHIQKLGKTEAVQDNNLSSNSNNQDDMIICSNPINPFIEKPFKQNEWYAATSTFNYFNKDPLLDWLSEYSHVRSELKLSKAHDSSAESFTKFIMAKGNQFESTIINILYKRFPNDIINIKGAHDNFTFDQYTDTVNAMKKGIPIIYSGALYNFDDNTRGIPDLIVRSDYINKLVSVKMLQNNEIYTPAPNLGSNYHYVIVDIKFKTLRLRADGIHLLNEGLIPSYKAQLFVYNKAIANIQGYDPKCCFLLGRAWSFIKMNIKHKGSSPFERLGKINYETIDSATPNRLKNALGWLKDMRENGKEWNPLNPQRPEMFPNMSNKYDAGWRNVKEKLADELKEITSVWMCGVKNRITAHSNNVMSWADKKCNSKTLGVTGEKIPKIVDQMLKINRSTNGSLIYPKYIKNNFCDWRTKKRKFEFFVDFETINDAITCELNQDSLTTGYSMIFMIGLGYMNQQTGMWVYESFTVDELSLREEGRICLEFNNRVENIIRANLKTPKSKIDRKEVAFFHWGSHEVHTWDDVLDRHCRFSPNPKWFTRDILWIDMLKVFKAEPIIPKGCLGFSLKEVAKKMYKNKMIQSTWDTTSKCSDGTGAMMACYNAAQECKKDKRPLRHHALIYDIEKYNKTDVLVIYEIITYLRNNHSKK